MWCVAISFISVALRACFEPLCVTTFKNITKQSHPESFVNFVVMTSNNPFKRLAGETAIYGLSSIIGKLLNWLLVPLYVRVFIPEEYGVVTNLYAYVAFLLVILTYGMETGFFRFSQKTDDSSRVFSTAATSVFGTSVLFVIVIAFIHSVCASATTKQAVALCLYQTYGYRHQHLSEHLFPYHLPSATA